MRRFWHWLRGCHPFQTVVAVTINPSPVDDDMTVVCTVCEEEENYFGCGYSWRSMTHEGKHVWSDRMRGWWKCALHRRSRAAHDARRDPKAAAS